jgi:competence protein CoiA-like protein
VEGRRRHVSDFAGVPPHARPLAQCEACERRLIMRLGRRRAPHYAHKPSSVCALTAPETALHYNTKAYLANKLEGQRRLFTVQQCSAQDCDEQLERTLARDWDEVHVERLLDPVRPDILLLCKGVPVLAIEVRATHIVSDGKAAILAQLGVPWVEVNAGFEAVGWEISQPLPVLRTDPPLPDWMCLEHTRREEAEKRQREQEEERAQRLKLRNQLGRSASVGAGAGEVWKVRVVDFYPQVGPRVRRAYLLYRKRLRGGLYRVWIADDVEQEVIAEIRATADPDAAARELHTNFARYLKSRPELTDSPVGWVDASTLPSRTEIYYRDRFPARYIRAGGDGPWQLVAG